VQIIKFGLQKLPILLVFSFIACIHLVDTASFSVDRNLDDYTLCFPEIDPLFIKLIREDQIKIFKLISEEKDKRLLDCEARFTDMNSARMNLDDFNREELRERSFPCAESYPDTCLGPR
jgi:hypothetical protein